MKRKRQNGFSIIEVILLIVLMGIAIPPLANLLRANLNSTGKMSNVSKTTFYLQQRMEQIIADYTRRNGYAYITVTGRYGSQTADGITTTVTVVTGTWNAVNYAKVTVTAAVPGMDRNISVTSCLPQGLF
jgi:Tfp pilus assembly protein PilV